MHNPQRGMVNFDKESVITPGYVLAEAAEDMAIDDLRHVIELYASMLVRFNDGCMI